MFSALSLILYLITAAVQLTLHQPSESGSTIPWSSLHRHLLFLKVILKLVLTAAFIFDKASKLKPGFLLASCFLMFYILYKRFVDSMLFQFRVHVLATSLDIVLCVCLLSIPMHILIDEALQLSTVVGIITVAIMLLALYAYMQQNRLLSHLESDRYLEIAGPTDSEVHFLRKMNIIEEADQSTFMFLHGKMSLHLDYCTDPKCECYTLIGKFDRAHRRLEDLMDKELEGLKEDWTIKNLPSE